MHRILVRALVVLAASTAPLAAQRTDPHPGILAGGSTAGSLSPHVAYAFEFNQPAVTDGRFFVVLRAGDSAWHVNRGSAEESADRTPVTRPRGWLVNVAAYAGRAYIFRHDPSVDSVWVDGLRLSANGANVIMLSGYSRKGDKPQFVGRARLSEMAFNLYMQTPHGQKSAVMEKALKQVPEIAAFINSVERRK
jgi:hypothetical protein